jgi:tetratricopeptide (TPR) repeat protein
LKNICKIFSAFIIFVLAVGCSTKKDAFLNRNFHSINTKYNVLYNGNEALRIGLQQLNSNYKDNYWERLPIEPLKVDELALPGMKSDMDSSPKEFEKAEEKAVKAVQRHSMLIARQERNKQIDDAYLLLGKARYYSKRFVPALEAFNYVIINYPRASLINETKIWQSKTHIRLRNEEQAIENLKILLKNKTINSKIIENAHTAIAMAYMEMDSLQQVVNHLKQAVLTNNNKEQTARNLFVLGQIYSENKVLDTANIYFQKVIDFKKAPYKYKIHAQIEKAKNISNKPEEDIVVEKLTKLIKNRDNRPYLDELYYQLGIIETKNNKDIAIDYFKKSLEKSKVRNFQKELSYEAMGNLYFDKAEFVEAAAYYDSILQITKNDNTKRVHRLKRKRANLNEVILYEKITKVNDSVISIASMSKEEQIAFFNSHIENLKAKDEKQQQKIFTGSTVIGDTNKKNETLGSWYFYNIQTVGFGEQEFKRIWGNRPLEDNWRLSDKTQINLAGNIQDVSPKEDVLVDTEKYKLSTYLDEIPSEVKTIDSLKNERNNAYYKLGVIYKEQFKELELARTKLEKLLSFNPHVLYSLPAKYHLYKIYENQNSEKASVYKTDIISNYPNSNYAKIIINPTDALSSEVANSAESEYALLFYDYKDENFEKVIEKSSEAILKFQGEPIIPKFELLRAYAIGKKEGLPAFKNALDFVVMNYPNTEEGKKALEVIENIKNKIKQTP